MIPFLQELYKQFTSVHSESYLERNSSSTVTYPYLTYDFDSEPIELHTDGFYIDVDIFDDSGNYLKIFNIESKLKDHFKRNRVMTDDVYIRFNFLRSVKIPTGDDIIKRRNLQFYCKVDWRKKEWV
ncbi:hypothetical protein ACFP65_08225 [Marinilactibacillus sp. GCM10026970]|uniref:hypothetical protein n=1 Tax=Marinilactibacillus sp. GCM10026970 TaxID=3252642 RepID=UPI00361DFC19